MAKYTIVYQAKDREMPYSIYCDITSTTSIATQLEELNIEEDEIQFIFEGWPRRVSLSTLSEDTELCEFRPF